MFKSVKFKQELSIKIQMTLTKLNLNHLEFLIQKDIGRKLRNGYDSK